MADRHYRANTTDGLAQWYRLIACLAALALANCADSLEEAFWNRSQDTRQLMEMVKAGDASAQTALGQRYEQGHGVERNRAKAVKWYQRAIEQDNPLAMFLLGQMYETDAQTGRDYRRAASLYMRAANQGHAAAQARLAQLYELGLGVPQDFTAAARWYMAAAKQWKLSDHYPLGSTYAIGRGDSKISSDAIRWFERAAGLGVAEAQFDLGLVYEVGNGVEKNLEKSIGWYQKAAAQGHDRATSALLKLHGTNRHNELPITMSEGTTSSTGEPLNLQSSSPPADREPENVQTTQDKIHSDKKSLSGQVFMAHVASYRSIKQAKAGWDQLLVDHHMALHDAKMEISTITLPNEGLFYRVEVGPFLSLDKARALCSTLEARQTYCRPLERKQ